MAARRSVGDVQHTCNFAVTEPARDQLGDLALARAENIAAHPMRLAQRLRHRRQALLTRLRTSFIPEAAKQEQAFTQERSGPLVVVDHGRKAGRVELSTAFTRLPKSVARPGLDARRTLRSNGG